MMKRNIFIILVMLAIMAGMTLNVLAIEEGTYGVSNNTHYVNPDTENSDDGGDVSIGEGMCRNAIYPQSYYEFKDGKHFVTLRIKMISFIKNVKIEAQTEKGNENAYETVEYTVSGQNTEEDTKDFRFEMKSADMLIKPSFFVGPMNRDVTFFVSLDMETATIDNGEFSSFNDIEPAENESVEDGGDSSPLISEEGDSSVLVSDEETAHDSVENEQVKDNKDNPISLSEENDKEIAEVAEFDEELIEKLPENEKASKTSSLPVIIIVTVFGVCVLLIFLKKTMK